MHFKNVLNFLGLWSYPFGLAVSSMTSFLYQKMQMQTFSLVGCLFSLWD